MKFVYCKSCTIQPECNCNLVYSVASTTRYLPILTLIQIDKTMFTMSGQRLGLTTYYRTISVDNKPTTVIIWTQ
jgi:hypothetical protein